MFKSKNLFWAVSDDTAKTLQGWFYGDGDLLNTLAHKIARCSNEAELKRFCFDLENVFTKFSDNEEQIEESAVAIPEPERREFIFSEYPVPPDTIFHAVERVKDYEKILGNIEKASVKKVIDNLNRAPDPLTEMIIRETTADVYQRYINLHFNISFQARRELHMLLRIPDSSLKLMFSEDFRELEYISKIDALQVRNNFNRILERQLNNDVEKVFEIMAKSKKSVWYDYPSKENGKDTMIDYIPESKELNYTMASESRNLFSKSQIKASRDEENVLLIIGEELMYGAFILNSLGYNKKLYELRNKIMYWQKKFLVRIIPESEQILENQEVKKYLDECVNFGLRVSKWLPKNTIKNEK